MLVFFISSNLHYYSHLYLYLSSPLLSSSYYKNGLQIVYPGENKTIVKVK